MIKKVFLTALFLTIGLILAGPSASIAQTDWAPKISPEELKNRLDEPDLAIIDVRSEREVEKGGVKIKGAVWRDRGEVETWAKEYDKNQTIVVYCA